MYFTEVFALKFVLEFDSQHIGFPDDMNFLLWNILIVKFCVELQDLQGLSKWQVNGRLFESLIAPANPICSVLVVIPIIGAIWGGKGNDHDWLQDLYLLNDRGGWSGYAGNAQNSLYCANPGVTLSVGRLTDIPDVKVVRYFETTWNSENGRVLYSGYPQSSDHDRVCRGFSKVNHISLQPQIKGIDK